MSWLLKLPANGLKKAAEGEPTVWVHATHVRDMGEAPGSWFQNGPALLSAPF